ncbi:MAG: hypothetical protein Q4B89_01000 [Lachnospiraceae bacterium]|nr:hypothetical protein [Lachnospiraceae bacterium]
MKVLSLAKLKEYTTKLLEKIRSEVKEGYVPKESGKGLSTNDYTAEDKKKLQGLEAPKIQIVKVNNQPVSPDGSKAVNIDLSNYAVKSDITNVYKYKGTKQTYAELPVEENVVGDVWNIEQADPKNNINAGDNVAWDGEKWDKLAGLTNGMTSDIEKALAGKVDKQDGKGLSTNDFTTEEKQKLAELEKVEEITTEELEGIFA